MAGGGGAELSVPIVAGCRGRTSRLSRGGGGGGSSSGSSTAKPCIPVIVAPTTERGDGRRRARHGLVPGRRAEDRRREIHAFPFPIVERGLGRAAAVAALLPFAAAGVARDRAPAPSRRVGCRLLRRLGALV